MGRNPGAVGSAGPSGGAQQSPGRPPLHHAVDAAPGVLTGEDALSVRGWSTAGVPTLASLLFKELWDSEQVQPHRLNQAVDEQLSTLTALLLCRDFG